MLERMIAKHWMALTVGFVLLLMNNGFEEYAEELRELDWK